MEALTGHETDGMSLRTQRWSWDDCWQLSAWGAALWLCWLGLNGLVAEWSPDLAMLEFGWLLLAPLVWRMSRLWAVDATSTPVPASVSTNLKAASQKTVPHPPSGQQDVQHLQHRQPLTALPFNRWDVMAIVGVMLVSWVLSLATASHFAGLPPAYHDEYSYLFQAESLLHGRWTWPSPPQFPELFDQYHLLNEGRLASRYYPGTGFWLAPWLALGHVYWAQWLAGALSAALLYLIGRELDGRLTGLVAGLSFAMAPGPALFGNLLLAHHAALLGLLLFLYGFVRGARSGRLPDFLLSGAGLGFALLCRPATAAGFGLPFAVWCLWQTIRGLRPRRPAEKSDVVTPPAAAPISPRDDSGNLRAIWLGYGIPLLVAIGIATSYNVAVTGHWRTSPYQLYTDIYTPRHVYGFNNVVRGEQRLGPKVLDDYDRWAENLTPSLALENARNRLLISGLWTLGIPLQMLTLVLALPLLWNSDRRWQCVAWAVVSLHAIHIPYWYVGIMGWHYVYETAALWCLLLGTVTARRFQTWRAAGASALCGWFLVLPVLAWSGMYLSLSEDWQARWIRGVQSIAYPRQQHAAFRDWVQQQIGDRPALVLIDQTASNPHLDFVVNHAGLTDRILYARYHPDRFDRAALIAAFPDRDLYVARPEAGTLTRLTAEMEPRGPTPF